MVLTQHTTLSVCWPCGFFFFFPPSILTSSFSFDSHSRVDVFFCFAGFFITSHFSLTCQRTLFTPVCDAFPSVLLLLRNIFISSFIFYLYIILSVLVSSGGVWLDLLRMHCHFVNFGCYVIHPYLKLKCFPVSHTGLQSLQSYAQKDPWLWSLIGSCKILSLIFSIFCAAKHLCVVM